MAKAEKPIPKGYTRYIFIDIDGNETFSCIALNSKSAHDKRDKHLKLCKTIK